jgi:hypothetical protein
LKLLPNEEDDQGGGFDFISFCLVCISLPIVSSSIGYYDDGLLLYGYYDDRLLLYGYYDDGLLLYGYFG